MKKINPKFKLKLFLVFAFMIAGQIKAADSLKYVMHSFFKIKTSDGMVLYIDPAMVNSFQDSADVVLITHDHSDHNEISRIKRKAACTIIRSTNALVKGVYKTFNIGKINIRAVPAYNSYHDKNQCVGYLITFPSENGDTIKIYHPGDTGKIDEMKGLANENITYAFFPMDGTYTMTPKVAAEAAEIIKAKHDIPIHTLPGYAGYSDSMAAKFTSPNKMVLKPGTTISLSNSATYIKEGNNLIPESFGLLQNYPNPFNPETLISYKLSENTNVQLKVFDLTGREIARIVDSQQNAGLHQVVFDGRNIASGVYIYTLYTNGFISSKKMVLTK
jgi:L-ascorbate metabolism protein UlaG (beta-lactamase superfamily)